MALAYADPIFACEPVGGWQASAARDSLASFTRRMVPGFIGGDHITQLHEALEAVERGEINRLIVTMPPRHSKSLNVSENFPAWYLGRHPDQRIIAASHTAQLAYTFSRRVRNKIADSRYPFAVTVADDKGAVQAWDTSTGGGYIAVGVGGSPTGHGGNLLFDDPIRSAADADSETVRDALWEWYTGTMRTRLQPGGWIILTACMVGDTAVSMANGSEKPLRDITIGDEILTFDDGEMTTSVVSNWIEYSDDDIYTVTMTSGRAFRANGRHPFLSYREGKLQWIRLENLQPTNCLIAAEGIGTPTGEKAGHTTEPMMVSCAARTDVAPLFLPRDTAARITTEQNGPLATDLPATMLSTSGRGISKTGMAWSEEPTTKCSTTSRGDAQSAAMVSIRNPAIRSADTSMSIMIIKLDEFEGFSVTDATLPSVDSSALNVSKLPFDTSKFQIDQIESIEYSGREPVYDITVDRTENFIADGVVSHNTRWHELDLTGRLLDAAERGGEQWDQIHMPAIDEAGNPLWPEFWPLDALERIRGAVGSRVWEAQYQGRPQPAEGGMFKRHWWRFWQPRGSTYPAIPVKMPDGSTRHVWAEEQPAWWDTSAQSWDMTFKETKSGSYVVGLVAATHGPNAYVLDCYRDRVEFTGAVSAVRTMTRKYPDVSAKLIEDKANGPAVIDTLQSEISGILPIGVDGSKQARAASATPRVEAGNWYLPHPDMPGAEWVPAFIDELAAFPTGTHDDQVDAFSQVDRYLMGGQGDFSDLDYLETSIFGGR